MDELRFIQSELRFDKMPRNGRELDESSRLTVQPLVKLILSFIRNKGYSVDNTKDIIKGLGFDIDDEYIDLVKKAVRISMSKKQTKRQEVKQYPPRYTTSKPKPIIDITTTNKPKLNLSHIHQVHQPQSISPSENTRKPTLSMSKSSHTGRDDKLDYSFGQISGIEADNRIWNTEGAKYFKAFDRINDRINELPKKTCIHTTNNVRASMKKLKHSKEISKRLTSWR